MKTITILLLLTSTLSADQIFTLERDNPDNMYVLLGQLQHMFATRRDEEVDQIGYDFASFYSQVSNPTGVISVISANAEMETRDLVIPFLSSSSDSSGSSSSYSSSGWTRMHPVVGTLDVVEIAYHVEIYPFTITSPGSNYRDLIGTRGGGWTADEGILEDTIVLPAPLTGRFTITGPTEEVSEEFSIPMTAIDSRYWKPTLNTAFKKWHPNSDSISSGKIWIYSTADWTEPAPVWSGMIDGANVLLDYHDSSASLHIDHTPEPSALVLLLVGLLCLKRSR